tara:strand:+ start:89 stop:643 length:555 start_codon:yes stop_codon:yes gene_type:complete
MSLNILIIGNCGVGKTYILKNLIKYLHISKANNVGLIHYLENNKYIFTGKYINSIFDGSDKLAMNVMVSLDDFLNKNPNKIIFYEGDRFSNNNFIKKTKPFIIKILGNGEKGRSIRGSSQSKRQIKSIQTRVNNIESAIDYENAYECLTALKNIIIKSNNDIKIFYNSLKKQQELKPKKQIKLF